VDCCAARLYWGLTAYGLLAASGIVRLHACLLLVPVPVPLLTLHLVRYLRNVSLESLDPTLYRSVVLLISSSTR
jgi:hypothetical protein